MDDPLVSIRHLRACGMCSRGARTWFSVRGLSWDVFVREGYPASVLLATDDALASQVVAQAKGETA